jgi:glycosyltransferase involved in cell wall biosynthesis
VTVSSMQMQGAVLNVKLQHLDRWNSQRREHARTYDALLAGCPGLRLSPGDLGYSRSLRTPPRSVKEQAHFYAIVFCSLHGGCVALCRHRARHPHLYAACDALYYGLNDRYSGYSSPNTLFTAVSHGIPTLATPGGEKGMVTRDTGCGLLLEPLTAETIAEAAWQLQDLATYAALCERARAAQSYYSWGQASNHLVKTVREAVSSRQEGRLCVG